MCTIFHELTSSPAQSWLHGLYHFVHFVEVLLPFQVQLGRHLVRLQAHPARQLEVGYVEIDPESRDDVVVAVKHLERLLQQVQYLVDVLDSDGVDLDEEVLHQFVNGLSIRLRREGRT